MATPAKSGYTSPSWAGRSSGRSGIKTHLLARNFNHVALVQSGKRTMTCSSCCRREASTIARLSAKAHTREEARVVIAKYLRNHGSRPRAIKVPDNKPPCVMPLPNLMLPMISPSNDKFVVRWWYSALMRWSSDNYGHVCFKPGATTLSRPRPLRSTRASAQAARRAGGLLVANLRVPRQLNRSCACREPKIAGREGKGTKAAWMHGCKPRPVAPPHDEMGSCARYCES